MKQKTLHILTGPTAVGKTELSLQWAKANNAEIVSCDSLLFYQGMNIGTAKPSKAELAAVPHHLIDITPPSKQISIKDYIERAEAIIAELTAKEKNILITGGSGFYLKAFYAPVVDTIPHCENATLRARKIEEESGLEGMLDALTALNPEGFGTLDTLNPRRVSKALERCLASGKTLSELQEAFANQPTPFAEYEKKITLLTRDADVLKKRIHQRVEIMIQQGLISEVKALLSKGIQENPSAAGSIGYRETIEYIQNGETTPASELIDLIALHTNQLVSKQRKWFRNQLKADKTLDLEQPIEAENLFQ